MPESKNVPFRRATSYWDFLPLPEDEQVLKVVCENCCDTKLHYNHASQDPIK
jgi:hypothetical protein